MTDHPPRLRYVLNIHLYSVAFITQATTLGGPEAPLYTNTFRQDQTGDVPHEVTGYLLTAERASIYTRQGVEPYTGRCV
jgi:hypothetical protein